MKMLAEDLVKQWDALHADPMFRNCAYKLELNERGQVIMSPPNNRHAQVQSAVYDLLKSLAPDGQVFAEYTVQTDGGIRTPDVVWCSTEWYVRHKNDHLATRAPEICVEVLSQSNTMAEMEHKRDLYFAKGCEESILVDLKGFVTFFTPSGQLEQSQLVPNFPKEVHPPA